MYKILVNCSTRKFKVVNETYVEPIAGYDFELTTGYTLEVSHGICAVIVYFTIDRIKRGRNFTPIGFADFCRDILDFVTDTSDILEETISFITNENGD